MSEWSLSIPEEIYDNYDKEVALPAFYERAVAAVKECESIPDSNEWKGKADAIIAYAQTVDDERLEKYLKDQAKLMGSLEINHTHQQIAEDLHSSRVVISRLLKQMESKGMIELKRNKVVLKEF